MRCLVTGATGYIGARLVPRLLAEGHRVRCLTRDATRLADAPWAGEVEVVEADLSAPDTLRPALAGVEVAYYLVHSLGQRRFEERDRSAAAGFGAIARAAGLRRIVYLGGPRPTGAGRGSAHLRSRDEVARILAGSGVPTAVLRAAVIIGSGSASFEMLRYLTERLPVMVAPRWVSNRVQPIAIRDVLYYLTRCAGLPAEVSRGFDIGGPDILSYADMMRRYAMVAGLRRRRIWQLRVLTPRLSSYWVGLVTPVPAAIAMPLVASLVQEAVTHEREIAQWIPDPPGGPLSYEAALVHALMQAGDRRPAAAPPAPGAVTSAGSASAPAMADPAQPIRSDPAWSGGTVYTDLRERWVAVPPAALWRVIEGIGGDQGWYSFPFAWSVRGWLDQLVGGIGRRRGRPTGNRLAAGDELDFWRVDEVVPGELLRLRAELRMPGWAWLELRVSSADGGARYQQRAIFVPRGLAGHAYWAAVWPFHAVIFGGMARNLAAAGQQLPDGQSGQVPRNVRTTLI